MNRRILVIGQLPPPHHGSNVMAEMFIKSLKDLGYKVTLVEKKFSRKIEEVRTFKIHKLFKIPITTVVLIYHLLKKKYDLCFYFLSTKPPSIFVDTFFLILIRIFRIKYVQYLHAKGMNDLKKSIISPLQSIIFSTISQSLGALVLGDRLKIDINYLIPNKNIFVLPNAVYDIKIKKDYANGHLNLPIKVLFLSNLMPSKGTMDFLKMAKNIIQVHKNVYFILAGPKMSQQFFTEICDFIRNENLTKFIKVTGPVYEEKKFALFAESDIFVFPSHDEAFGLVNLEAMSVGLPIVSYNEGSIPEIVMEGINGFIVDHKNIDMLSDSVLKLIKDSKLRMKMGCAGRKMYERKYKPEKYKENLERGLFFFERLKHR